MASDDVKHGVHGKRGVQTTELRLPRAKAPKATALRTPNQVIDEVADAIQTYYPLRHISSAELHQAALRNLRQRSPRTLSSVLHAAIDGMIATVGDPFTRYHTPSSGAARAKELQTPQPHRQWRDGRVVVIALDRFRVGTAKGIDHALRHADEAIGPLDGLVLRLEDNGGGLFGEAIDTLRLFVGGARPMLRRQHNAGNDTYHAPRKAPWSNLPIVVTTNQYSASAAEAVALGLQAANRATIVGDRTRGKGLGQILIPLQNGAQLAVTHAVGQWWDGSRWQPRHKSPVIPDLQADALEFAPHVYSASDLAHHDLVEATAVNLLRWQSF